TIWPTTRATSKPRRNSVNALVPLTASTRRTPEETEPSPTSLIRPISPVAPVCVPPQSSVEKSPILTTRTRSPYFSPNNAIAPSSFTATSIGTSTSVCTVAFPSTCRFTMSSICCNSSSATPVKCEKSNRSREAFTSDPACFTCLPRTSRSAAWSRCVPVWLRSVARRFSTSTTVSTTSPTAIVCRVTTLCAKTPCTGLVAPLTSATTVLWSSEYSQPISPTCPPESA